MKTRFLELATALLLLAPAIGTRADTSFAYQGRLLNEKGQMLGENQRHHSIKFSIYDLASGGEPLWNCTRDVYLSSDGQFSVELAGNSVSGGTLGALFAANVDKTLYIGLTVGDGAEIAPRQKIMTVPKAVWAADCMAAKGNLSVSNAVRAKAFIGKQAVSVGSLSTSGQLKCGALAVGAMEVKNNKNLTVDGVVSGKGVIPVGGIVIWNGAANQIPLGWAVCNGQNGTPDLRNLFVVAAGDKYLPGAKGGADAVTLTVQQMPSHNHAYKFTGADVDQSWDSDNYFYCQHNQYSNNANTKYTEYSCDGQAHENRPPFYALCYIMRVR